MVGFAGLESSSSLAICVVRYIVMSTGPLSSLLLAQAQFDPLADDCVRLIEDQVRQRRGIKGVAMRTGLGVLKASKPDILNRAVRHLLPEFASALEPLYAEFRKAGASDFSAFLNSRRAEATQALLHIVDHRIERSQNGLIRSTYARLRGDAERDVDATIGGLANIIAARLPRTAEA
jgi:hypothetical protein